MASMKKIVLLTSNELRHEFFRKYLGLSSKFRVVKTYCECNEQAIVEMAGHDGYNNNRLKHLAMRQQTEIDFFQLFCTSVADNSHPKFISKGDINKPEYVHDIIALQPDVIIAYGCSIIQPPLIDAFAGRFINVHLGLSPYYRGAGTNFWPFVNGEPEFVGVTFMHIDKGVDTGAIIHQMQATITCGDNIHQIGNRLIKDMAKCCAALINNFEKLELPQPSLLQNIPGRYYRKKDFTEASVTTMYQNFADGLIDQYLHDVKMGRRKVLLKTN